MELGPLKHTFFWTFLISFVHFHISASICVLNISMQRIFVILHSRGTV